MKNKLLTLLLLVFVSGLAISVDLENPINGDLKTSGFIPAVAVVEPSSDCRVYRGAIEVYDNTGSKLISKPITYRGVAPSGVEVNEQTGKGIWSGYWDASDYSGEYNVTVVMTENCAGATNSGTDYAEVTIEPKMTQAGVAGSLNRAGDVATSGIIMIFGVDLAQIVDPNTATTLIDEFGGMSFALLLFGFVLPFVLSFAILYDMFFLVGFFRPNTARLIALVIALLFSRANGFGALYGILFTVFSNFWISMLSLLFMMMVIYWVLGHLIWGYKFAQEINTQEDAMNYLHKIGSHLDKLEESK